MVALAVAATMLVGCQIGEVRQPAVATVLAPSLSDGYTTEELAIYRHAVRRVDAFEAASQPILAAGRATREAMALYRNRLTEWKPSYAQLQAYERDGVKIARAPMVLSTGMAAIKSFQDNAAEVVLIRCTDQSDLGVTREGVVLPPVHEDPVIQEVVVNRYENRTWKIESIVTTDRLCAG